MALPGGLLDPSLTLTLQPKTLIGISCFVGRKCTSTNNKSFSPSKSLFRVVRCSSASNGGGGDGDGGGLKNALSGIVDKRVEELLGKEENKALFDNLNKASERVEIAKQQLADIRRQELESQQMRLYINRLESKAAEIAECEKEVLEGKAMVEEAERSLSMTIKGNGSNKDDERWESVKAALISASVGTLAGLPIYLTKVATSPQLLLQLGITFASCALFGVTFRYAVRRDLDNIQLKTGTAAAFAFVQGCWEDFLGTL